MYFKTPFNEEGNMSLKNIKMLGYDYQRLSR